MVEQGSAALTRTGHEVGAIYEKRCLNGGAYLVLGETEDGRVEVEQVVKGSGGEHFRVGARWTHRTHVDHTDRKIGYASRYTIDRVTAEGADLAAALVLIEDHCDCDPGDPGSGYGADAPCLFCKLRGLLAKERVRQIVNRARRAGEGGCDRPPVGWSCTRDAGHDGPCAAVPTSALRLTQLVDPQQQPEEGDRG